MSIMFENPEYQQRFSGIARLYSVRGLEALSKAHMMVAGLGGVGSWTAEALARSGIGEITLVDLDDICVTNTNRQSHALKSTIGRTKAQTLQQRLIDINPLIRTHIIEDFLDKTNITTLVLPKHHLVIDATDAAHIKAALAAYCLARKIGIVTVGSAGGKRDPNKVTHSDLGHTTSDPMLAKVRQHLYKHYRFARDPNRKFRIDAIYSTEQMVYPKPNGDVCQQKSAMNGGVKLDCSGGFGASTMVAGSFGFLAAARAIERYLQRAI